jgi:hypothetical protein
MNSQSKLVVDCKNSITTKSNILSNPHFFLGCPHNPLMHEFYHYPIQAIIVLILVVFLALPIIPSRDDLATKNVRLWQIAQPLLFYFMPTCLQLG